MSFLKSIFGQKDEPIKSNSDFWNWFLDNEKKFHAVVKNSDNIKEKFFDRLSPKLNELKDGIWYLSGMFDENTAELILTADGAIENIAFIEDLIDTAPKIQNWKLTALKQPSDLDKYGIEMEGFKFGEETMCFYSLENPETPDEIEIEIAHKDFSEENKGIIANGTFLALDNYLGELKSVTTIDNVRVINPKDAKKELVPFSKLKDFLLWREKEFIEKYEGLRHDTENDSYSSLEATLNNGLPLLAIINTDLLNWDCKASHPWIAVIKINYDGQSNNGMPNNSVYQLMNTIEDEMMIELKDNDGYLNLGRQTADNVREIYFACIDFRKPSKIFYRIQSKYSDKIKIEYEIYKDKYWQSFDRFKPN